MLLIPALGRPRQGVRELKASLGYITRPCLKIISKNKKTPRCIFVTTVAAMNSVWEAYKDVKPSKTSGLIVGLLRSSSKGMALGTCALTFPHTTSSVFRKQ
jgi:hypothetical protein